MKWLLNASINTLPSKANLRQWGKVTNDNFNAYSIKSTNDPNMKEKTIFGM